MEYELNGKIYEFANTTSPLRVEIFRYLQAASMKATLIHGLGKS
jgi:hypothetical protein